jgi:hypothetical protein
MRWILIIAWASSGTGYTMQEFETLYACQVAKIWVDNHSPRSHRDVKDSACINKATGEVK